MTAAADLTADQQEAADAFAAWLKQPVDGTPFVLSLIHISEPTRP